MEETLKGEGMLWHWLLQAPTCEDEGRGSRMSGLGR